MNQSSTEKPIIALGPWLLSPAGSYVRSWEEARLASITADIFGFNAVQVGLPEIDGLAASRMPHRWILDTGPPRQRKLQAVVTHDYGELPFATQSLDLVVLPHVLEFAHEPHQVLREVERVLIPEGQLIVCGFNPASLWGARQAAAKLIRRPFLPQSGELISVPRLKDWLKLLNMEVHPGHFGCYAPPCDTERWLQRFEFLERSGPRWWPYLGGIYIVQAIKRVKGMRLIGPAWNRKKAAARQGVPVTNKHINHKKHG
jgi:SAM-dependent methyltransferase